MATGFERVALFGSRAILHQVFVALVQSRSTQN
jgi:hypothetical protein